jgi:hypothetical protein
MTTLPSNTFFLYSSFPTTFATYKTRLIFIRYTCMFTWRHYIILHLIYISWRHFSIYDFTLFTMFFSVQTSDKDGIIALTCIFEGRPQWGRSFRVLCFHHRLPRISSAYHLHPLSALEIKSTFFAFFSFFYLLVCWYLALWFGFSCTYLTFSSITVAYSYPCLQLPNYLFQFRTYYCHIFFVSLYHEICLIFRLLLLFCSLLVIRL